MMDPYSRVDLTRYPYAGSVVASDRSGRACGGVTPCQRP